MTLWTKQDREAFVKEALKSFRWVPCAFVMLLVEETGACPYKIAKMGFRHIDTDNLTVKIGLHTYPISAQLNELLKEQKARLSFQKKAFPVFRQSIVKWGTLSKTELEKDFVYLKRRLNLPLYLTVNTLRISIFRDRINEGQLPTKVAKDMHLSVEEFERFWRLNV